MRHLIILALCASTLTACGDTQQAAPVDDVEARSLPAPEGASSLAIPHRHRRAQ